jgi:ubiquinone/menaquinone biosynthesis C-methylase UbiE
MPDVWSAVADLDIATQERLADVLETRGGEPKQRSLRETFLSKIAFSPASRVLEVGCGTGALTRVLACWPGVESVVGVDPAPLLLERARVLSDGLENVSYQEGDGRSLPFPDATFDVVVFDSTLCHVPGPERAVAEAFRVLREDGVLAVFDGDYATTTVALGDDDPLQVCVEAMMANSVHDRWLVRRLPALVRERGFALEDFRSHGFIEVGDAAYMLTVIDRGVDLLRSAERIGDETAAALKAEARLRVAEGRFFGHIAYASLIGRKSAQC